MAFCQVAKALVDIIRDQNERIRYALSKRQGRFAFAEHRDYRLYALLADGPQCWTTLSISAPGYHTRRCIWTSTYWCPSGPMRLPHLTLQPERVVISEKDAAEDLWSCLESAKEQAH